MNDLQQELRDLKGFIEDLKADRAAQKEKEKKESWTKYTSLSLVFIAVLAAVANQWAGKYSSRVLVRLNDATYNQSQASDQWAYYQAKSIKQNLYELAREQANGKTDPASEEKAKAKIEKYEKEKADITQQAKKFEEQRDADRKEAAQASAKGGRMGQAVAVYQVAIALGSLCLLTKRKPLWYMALLFSAYATIEMIKAWMM
jgi:hypothetical protein